jgi:hypothetical protein
VQEFDDVELVDQGIGEFDKGLGQQRLVHRLHLASFIGSIVLATADDHQAVYLSVSCLSGHSSRVVVSEADAAGHYVGGQLRQVPVGGERAGSQTGESLAHGDAS